MTDYKAMIEEHSCKPNQGCGVMTICMCGVAEDMADEIERLREALHKVLGIVGNFPIDRFEYNVIKKARAALGEEK